MKHIVIPFLLVLLTAAAGTAEGPQGKSDGPTEQKDRISYSIGYQIGGDLQKQKVDVDEGALLRGVKEGLEGSVPQMKPEEMQKTLTELKSKIMAEKRAEIAGREQKQLKIKEKYAGEGRDFLEANAKKEGVITLESGLQYRVINKGAGKTPGPNDKVTVQYRGTLIDGTEFDSTYHDNKPETFRVDGVIKGWTEALQLMKEGDRWQLFVPADLAYGERGPLADRVVIFELELISVEHPG